MVLLNRKVFLYALIFSLSPVLSSTKLLASSTNDRKIVFVDMQQIESESLAVIDLVKKLQEKQQVLQNQIDVKSKDLQREAESLESKKAMLSAEVFVNKQKDLQTKFLAFQRETQKKNESLQEAKVSSLAEIDSKVKEIIANISVSKHYDLVLASQFTLYVNQDVYNDITREVVDSLNKKVKTIDISKYFNSKVDSPNPSASKKK